MISVGRRFDSGLLGSEEKDGEALGLVPLSFLQGQVL